MNRAKSGAQGLLALQKNRSLSTVRRRNRYPQAYGQAMHAMLKNELRDILALQKAEDKGDWLESLTLRQEGHTLHVSFPHFYFASWFSQHKRDLFEKALSCRFADAQLPHIVYEQPTLGSALGHAQPWHSQGAEQQGNGQKTSSRDNSDHALRSIATAAPKTENDAFTAFIANAKNAFPLAAAKEIAEQRAGVAYNPFLLCGHSGTGKSHILRSMAATLRHGQSGNRVILASAARFCADNPAWVRHPELFWQQCDVLLLDDIQDIAGQSAWQQKLVSCIDACPNSASLADGARRAGQMVFACTGQPQTLKTLDERLRSRLESGLVVELMEPDLDVRMRYLQVMCKERNMSLSRDQLLYIAQRCSQFRLLQGLLLKVVAFCSVTGCELSQADLENIVRTGVADKTPGCLEILGEVARAMNLRPDDVLGGKRRPDLVLARQISMYICRRKLGLSYPELGRAFGGKDHSTVIHAIKKIKKIIVSDKALQQMVTELELKTQ